MESREERVARNETLFREVNERILQLNRSVAVAEESDFLCECGDGACTEPIALTLAEYEAVRAEPTRFAVVPGHAAPDVERIVMSNGRYAIVEKDAPVASEIAEESDPRS